ncbi:hypothetical protein [Thermococcus piezophilus]|uniref:hypothetical protein n=1 Tax=Thermococcus piezophilus TaxID=1712654 RepID=UPI0018FF979E|nr:hypothetical protein [Thermococcus piezophilus]
MVGGTEGGGSRVFLPAHSPRGFIALLLNRDWFPEGTCPHYPLSCGFLHNSERGMILMGWLLAVWAMKTFRGIAIPKFIDVLAS